MLRINAKPGLGIKWNDLLPDWSVCARRILRTVGVSVLYPSPMRAVDIYNYLTANVT